MGALELHSQECLLVTTPQLAWTESAVQTSIQHRPGVSYLHSLHPYLWCRLVNAVHNIVTWMSRCWEGLGRCQAVQAVPGVCQCVQDTASCSLESYAQVIVPMRSALSVSVVRLLLFPVSDRHQQCLLEPNTPRVGCSRSGRDIADRSGNASGCGTLLMHVVYQAPVRVAELPFTLSVIGISSCEWMSTSITMATISSCLFHADGIAYNQLF